MTRMSLCLSVGMCALVGLTSVPLAEAEIISVTAYTTRDYESAPHYTYAEITIHGSFVRADGSIGQYTVPAVVIYPRDRGNGVRVVDWLNCAFYHFFPPSTEFGTFQFTLLATGNHLFEQGYTYATVLWDKAVTEIFGPSAPHDGHVHNHLVFGSIERSANAWEILLDTGRLLKNPRLLPSDRHAVRKVLSSGYSQDAAAQREVITAGLDPSRVDDGHLIQMIGGHLPSVGARLRSECVLHAQRGQSQLAPIRSGGDLASPEANSRPRCPEPESRGRQAALPCGLR